MLSMQDLHICKSNHRVLLKAKEYICLSPHLSLRAYISNYNITFPSKGLMSVGFTAMPSGCATLSIENDGRKIQVKLEGPTLKPYIFCGQSNQPEMVVTIEFRPAGLYALIGITQRELVDKTVSFDEVDSSLCKLLSDTVESTNNVDDLITNLDMLLLRNVYTACHPQLPAIFQNIFTSGGNISIRNLSMDAHYSERQLNRLFQQQVGAGGKAFSRLVRINNAFRLLKKPQYSTSYISDVLGFHDLSHFVRDFKLVCGITPQDFRENMSDFYFNPTRL